MKYAAALSVLVGVVLLYGCWRTLNNPLPQYTIKAGAIDHRTLAGYGLIIGAVLVVFGLLLALEYETNLFSP